MEPSQLLSLTKHLFALAFVLVGVCFFVTSSRRASAKVRAARTEGDVGNRLRFWYTIQLRLLAIAFMLIGITFESPTPDIAIIGGVLILIVMFVGFFVPAFVMMRGSSLPEGRDHQGRAMRDTTSSRPDEQG